MSNKDISFRDDFFEDLLLELGADDDVEAYFYHDEDGKISFDIRDEGSFLTDEEDWVLGTLPLNEALDLATLKDKVAEALKEYS